MVRKLYLYTYCISSISIELVITIVLTLSSNFTSKKPKRVFRILVTYLISSKSNTRYTDLTVV